MHGVLLKAASLDSQEIINGQYCTNKLIYQTVNMITTIMLRDAVNMKAIGLYIHFCWSRSHKMSLGKLVLI